MKINNAEQPANYLIVSIKEPSGRSTYYGSAGAVNAELHDLKNHVLVREILRLEFLTKEKMLVELEKRKGELINADRFEGFHQQLA